MATRADLVDTNYRLRVRTLREAMLERVRRAYAQVRSAEEGRLERVRITPDMATSWLAGTAPRDQAKVEAIARGLVSDGYQDDPGNPIQLTPDGTLLNGAHRLTAIASTGLTVSGTVAYDVPPGAIVTTFASFVPQASRVISAGQSAGETLSRAYVAAAAAAAGLPFAPPVLAPSLAGTSKVGGPISTSLAGVRPMILSAIRDGRSLAEAIAFGDYLATRLADNELTRVVDATIEAQASRRAIGWEGTVYGPEDDCRHNAGFHPFSQSMYRHGGCRCERRVVFA
jgi:hypothetical protein